MLTFFRRMFTSKIGGVFAAIFVGIIGVAFAMMDMTGISGFGGGSGESLATVEGESIAATEITDQVNRQLARAREQQPDLDMNTFLASGAYEQILSQMISSKAMEAFGHDQGLAVSKRMVDREIASIPAFHNLAGKFDDAAFRTALRNQNMTEHQLRQDIAGSLIQRQILLPVAGSPKVPHAMADRYASLLLEQRSGSVGLVPTRAMPGSAEPTDADVGAFFKANVARYTIPERRVLRYAFVGPEQVSAAATPTNAEIEAFYRANSDKYGAKQDRTLSQVVLPDEKAAKAFAAKLAAGTSFAQAASQAGFSAADTALGKQDKEAFAKLTSAAVANAAFAAAQGATTQPLQSSLGWHIIRVDAVNNIAATPLAAVRAEIEKELGTQKQEEALATLVGRIEDALGEGSSFEEVATAEKLAIQETPPITGSGIQFDNPNWKAPELQPLLKTAFDMGPDEDPVVETLVPGKRFAVLAIGRVVPAAPPALAEIKGRVKADLVTQRASDQAKAAATAIVAKINAGTPIAKAFADAKLPLPPVQPVSARRIDIARPNQPVPPPLALIFSMPKGKARILRAPNGEGWFVVHLGAVVPGNASSQPGLIEATRGQFERIMGEEYADQFARAVTAGLKVKRNEQAIQTTKQSLRRGGSVE